MFLQLDCIQVHLTCSTQTWQHRLASGKPIASLRCFTNAHSGKTHTTFIVLDLQLATVSRTKMCLAHISMHWVMSRVALLPPLCPSVRSSWTDASASTKCFARWNDICEFRAFCPSRSSAARIRSHVWWSTWHSELVLQSHLYLSAWRNVAIVPCF